MEISSCIDDFQELLVYLAIVIIAEVFLCFVVSGNIIAIIVCIILDIFLSIDYVFNWYYLCRKIILDKNGCSFVSRWSTKTFAWEEVYLQHVKNDLFLFGDCEIPGEGIILSSKPISKPAHIGAMTYCRFSNPRTSVFIRFESSSNELKKTTAKFVYQGFTANKNDVLFFVDTTGNLNK